jgi:signal transduction histidine kinase
LRAKQSFTATEIYSSPENITPLPLRAGTPALTRWRASDLESPPSKDPLQREGCGATSSFATGSVSPHGEDLLHDARNLIGTLGLYCDLLSMPGVLKHEHRQYADDLRLVGSRSGAMIERLINQLVRNSAVPADQPMARQSDAVALQPAEAELSAPRPVSLRRIVERCSGLLSRVAGGYSIEVSYGEAAAVPVCILEEAVERILVNLVRNASAALGDRRSSAEAGAFPRTCQCGEPASASIRIGVGMLANRIGDPRPWPFRRVRITVEDSGRGMTQQQLEALVCASRPPSRGTHGIGFRVVQQLVANSGGDLRVMSAPGVGTCIQIEWPMAASVTNSITEQWPTC